MYSFQLCCKHFQLLCFSLSRRTHSPATSLKADNNIDLNAIKASLMYNEHFVPRCAIPWQGLPLSQGWRPIKGTQFMSPEGKKTHKFALQLQNCAGEQKLRSPRGVSQIFCQRWNREGGEGNGFSPQNQLILPASTLKEVHTDRSVDLQSDHALWSVPGAEMQGLEWSAASLDRISATANDFVKMTHCQSNPRHKNQTGHRLTWLIQQH